MKKARSILSGCVILMICALFGCSTYTIVAYDSARLQQDRVATLAFSQNQVPLHRTDIRVDVKAVDSKEVDNKNDSKWNSNLGPASIELLPGSHSLSIEFFYPAIAGGQECYLNVCKYYGPTRRSTVARKTVAVNAEAGHDYILSIDKVGSVYEHLRFTIEDRTTGKVVYPPPRDPMPFSLSEIPKDKAVVCFYRESRTLAVGTSSIAEKNKVIERLGNGSFVYHVTAPGSHTYSMAVGKRGPGESTTVNLTPGVVSYIRASYWDLRLTFVPEPEALKIIRSLDAVK